ncbi:PREDICTED: MAP kinase-activated protein kinase 5-like [Amphimedon queenslandica]|uniref:non-specific serine/threonine protein kinase n=1 Tax=Amphimedon queenslandica TaxID=400682 RepID=A0A1X7VNY0_AMPQE|nr:PREDICTED: MAP kinase-activated protein kinase 5-like [Amphimedon queenslandica]|eukprot:XP_003383677.1 PREDICTED: MAP kinase-activated protein kinase 5-like [Amphimedon queenslandica]
MSKYERDPEFKKTSILDDYEIKWNRSLGTGVSGPVRLCIHRATGKEYALKLLLDRSDRKKAEIEATLHWRCSGGDHIVRIVDIYRNEIQQPGELSPKKRILLVMELMEGKELFDYISKRHHFTEHEASKYILQIVRGVQFCHRLNIAHRDIKPENLLLLKPASNPEDVVIKLSDFGFAKVDNGDLKTPQFTPYYVAPQVLEAQKRQKESLSGYKHRTPYYYDKSCDIWSIGVIMYIMLCGYPPFYSEVPHQALSNRMKQKIMSADFDFPENDWKAVTDEAKDLIRKMLCVEPSERLSIEEVLHHPWLAQNASPNRDLNSPYLISDKDALVEVQGAHAKLLQNFRRDDTGFYLKPLGQAKNPVLASRMKKQEEKKESGGAGNESEPSSSKAVQSLKSLMDVCNMPPPPPSLSSESSLSSSFLSESVKNALVLNEHNASLLKALEQESWNGNEFIHQVNCKRLASSLQELIEQLEP